MLDDRGRVWRRTDARGIVSECTRNWRGQVLTKTVGGNQEDTFAYDALGRQTLARRDASNEVTRTYNYLGNITSETQTVLGVAGKTFTCSYDQVGNPLMVMYPTGVGLTVRYNADGLDNLYRIRRGTTEVITYQYVGNGWTNRVVNLGGSPAVTVETTVSRDGMGRRVYGVSTLGKVGGVPTFEETFAYTRDLVGDPTLIVRSGNIPTQQTTNYTYDTMHRFYQADDPGERTSLDALGNRYSYLGVETPTQYYHNNVNEYTEILTYLPHVDLAYDANGNMTRNERDYRFEYDTENRLTVIRDSSNNVLATFTYDALGRRTSETRDGVTTLFYYNRDNVVLEYNLADPATPLRYYIQG